MAASRYEGECKHCGVVASAKDRNKWRELLRLPCCCGQRSIGGVQEFEFRNRAYRVVIS